MHVEESLPIRPKKHKWMLWAALGSIAVFLVSPVVVFNLKNRAAFDRKVAELAAAGYPVSLDDLERGYQLPPGVDNAADVYMEAFRCYVEPNEIERELLPVRGNFVRTDEMPPYPDAVMTAIRASLDQNRRCLDLLYRAARMEQCRFPRTRDKAGFNAEYLSEIKRSAQLLVERNLYLAQRQQNDDLVDSMLTCIGLTNSDSAQPFLINHLVAVAMKAMAAESLEDAFSLTTFSAEHLAALQRAFKRMRTDDSFTKALQTEHICAIELLGLPLREQIEQFGYSGFGNVLDKPLFMLYSLSGLKYGDGVLLLEFTDRINRAAQLPLHQQLAVMKTIEADWGTYSEVHWLLAFGSSYAKIFEINLRGVSSMLCAETALAIERYRLDHHALPESLEALVPAYLEAVPLDPFDGAPLRYIRQDNGEYSVYTIGSDGIDQGGISQEQARKSAGRSTDQHDWPFTVKPRSQKSEVRSQTIVP